MLLTYAILLLCARINGILRSIDFVSIGAPDLLAASAKLPPAYLVVDSFTQRFTIPSYVVTLFFWSSLYSTSVLEWCRENWRCRVMHGQVRRFGRSFIVPVEYVGASESVTSKTSATSRFSKMLNLLEVISTQCTDESW